MHMPLCDNNKCKGYHEVELEEGEVQSSRGPEDFDPVLLCPKCETVYDIEEWDVDVDEDGPFITTKEK